MHTLQSLCLYSSAVRLHKFPLTPGWQPHPMGGLFGPVLVTAMVPKLPHTLPQVSTCMQVTPTTARRPHLPSQLP